VSLYVDELGGDGPGPLSADHPTGDALHLRAAEGKAVTVLKPEQKELLSKMQGSPRWKAWVGEAGSPCSLRGDLVGC
jgi:hypothetical protein